MIMNGKEPHLDSVTYYVSAYVATCKVSASYWRQRPDFSCICLLIQNLENVDNDFKADLLNSFVVH